MILSTKKKSFEMEKEPAQSRVTAIVVAGPWNQISTFSVCHCNCNCIVLIVNFLVFCEQLASYPHCHCHPVMLIWNCILWCFGLTFVSIGKSSPSKTPNTGAQPLCHHQDHSYRDYDLGLLIIIMILGVDDNRDNSNWEGDTECEAEVEEVDCEDTGIVRGENYSF